jgi:hypothetical protein
VHTHHVTLSLYTANRSPVIAANNPREVDSTVISTTSNAVAVLLLVDIASQARLWGYARFVMGRFALRRIAGLQFFKVLGSGYEGGFGLHASSSRQGLFALFDSPENAENFLNRSSLCEAYRQHAREFFSVKLKAYSCRGAWAGQALPLAASQAPEGTVAVLTRASIRPTKALSFWKKAPPAERSLEASQGCLLAAGLGEAPIFRQATFSLWTSVAAMEAYARQGAHLEAIKAAHEGGYFSESMFVRFVPEEATGVYKGVRYGG